MISLNDVLLAMSNIPVDDPIAEIWGRGLQGGYRIIEYTGSLPITINANGDALLDYRIYGADGGVGVATENLFDKDALTDGSFLRSDGSVGTFGAFSISDFIPVEEGEYLAYQTRSGYTGCYNCIYDKNKNFLRSIYTDSYQTNVLMTIGSNEKYIRITLNDAKKDVAMVVKGSTAPANYIPYGYKLPMTVSVNYEYVFTGNELFYNSYGRYQFSLPKAAIKNSNASNTSCSHFPYGTGLADSGTFSFNAGRFVFFGVRNEYPTIPDFKQFLTDQYNAGTPMRLKYFLAPSDVPVYIGDTQLEEGEYVSYGEQKIYRDVRGTLTPTDPPVPLPEIPTIDGTTVIDYDGDPKPSQMYVKYKGKG